MQNKVFSHPTNQLVHKPETYYLLVESKDPQELPVFNNLIFNEQKALISFGEKAPTSIPRIKEIQGDSYQHLSIVFIPNENKDKAIDALNDTLNKWEKGQDNYFNYFEYGAIVIGIKETQKGLLVMLADQAVFFTPIQDRDDFFGASFKLDNIEEVHKNYNGNNAAYLTIEECDLENSKKETFWDDIKKMTSNKGVDFINFCKDEYLSASNKKKLKLK